MVTLITYHFTIIRIAVLLMVCHPVFAFKAVKNQQFILLVNPTSFNRYNEVIMVERKLFGKQDPALVPEIKKQSQVLISQMVDKSGDGIWDELFIEINVRANATDTLQVSWINKIKQIPFAQRTNVRLSLRSDNATPSADIARAIRSRGFTQNIAKPFYQMEGPGIENDKVAFRAFFDSRNGKDIYGKITEEPVLEKVGVGSSWHELQTWGMDILRVGNSLGAGALAIEEGNKIYPLADADTSVFKSLYEGPLQAAFKLSFTNWDVANGKQNGSETISISKGSFFYKNDIAIALHDQQKLVAGIAHFSTDSLVYKKHNAAFSSVSTYSIHAEAVNSKIGIAIMFPTLRYVNHQMSDSLSPIPNTGCVALLPAAKNTSIYFFACWEKTDARFSTQQGFNDYLQATATALAAPVQIKIITKK